MMKINGVLRQLRRCILGNHQFWFLLTFNCANLLQRSWKAGCNLRENGVYKRCFWRDCCRKEMGWRKRLHFVQLNGRGPFFHCYLLCACAEFCLVSKFIIWLCVFIHLFLVEQTMASLDIEQEYFVFALDLVKQAGRVSLLNFYILLRLKLNF